jgi:putative intracellular protease/amidase
MQTEPLSRAPFLRKIVPGGRGPMMDLLDDPDAGTVMRHFHKTSKPTAVLCHGPISLLSALPNSTEVGRALAAADAVGAREKAQGWIYSGYKMTIFSAAEVAHSAQTRLCRHGTMHPNGRAS